jgi:ethanolamine permease
MAIIIPGLITWGVVIVYNRAAPSQAISSITQISVFGALSFYILTMIGFVVLRMQQPHLDRQYRSPLGIPGAILAAVLACIAMAASFSYTAEARESVLIVVGIVVCGLIYFGLVSRHRLIAESSDEETRLIERAEHELASDFEQPEPHVPQ